MDHVSAELVKRFKNNDENAFNALLAKYEGYLYRICYSYTRSKEESLDMMQEVYIKLFLGLKSFDETKPILPWLKRVTINTLINQYKKNKQHEVPLDSNWSQNDTYNVNYTPINYLSSDESTEEKVVFNSTCEVIDSLIKNLPEHYRLALTLRYQENMNYHDIARLLEQPIGTTKSNVYRARKMLREKMLACELLEA